MLAADAEGALNYLRQEKVDIVLTDLKLPGMSDSSSCRE
jgi:YesN/AraC family two-component response regulator